MGSYIKTDDFEYDEKEYDNIIEAYLSFTKEMITLCKENQTLMFNSEIAEKVLVKKLSDEKKQNMPLFKRVCALVYQSRMNIIEKNKHEPSTVRIASLFVYYIIKLQPVKAILLTKSNGKVIDKFGWYDLEMSTKFGMHFAKYFFEKHNEKHMKDSGCENSDVLKCETCKKCIFVDFLLSDEKRHREYRDTLMFTLTHKTVSKAMIIQLFDYFDKYDHKHDNKNKIIKKAKSTVRMPDLQDGGENNE